LQHLLLDLPLHHLLLLRHRLLRNLLPNLLLQQLPLLRFSPALLLHAPRPCADRRTCRLRNHLRMHTAPAASAAHLPARALRPSP
jgi:hypothetical protein